MNALWTWMTTDSLGIGITSGVAVLMIGAIGLGIRKWLFKSKPPTKSAETQLTAKGDGIAQAAGTRALAVQSQNGNPVAHTGEGAQTIIQGVPHEDHASLAKQLGITEDRLNRLSKTLEGLGIPPDEAPARLPEILERLKSAEGQLDNAPKVGGRTDELRQQAETAIAADDIDAAEELLRQAENQDAQAQHQLLDESHNRALAAAASAYARGDLAFSQFKYLDAGTHFRRAAEHYPESAHQQRIEALIRAGRAFDEAAAFQPAEDAYNRARVLAQSHLDDNDPLTAVVLSNLATLYQATNRRELAEPLMERALAIDEKAFGPDHPDVAIDLNNLGQLYKATNRMKLAEPLMERALAIDEKAFGPDHPKVAIRLNNFVTLYYDTNRRELAEPLMERVISIFEKAYGETHPQVAVALNNLATLYQATNRREQAEPLMERALRIDEKVFGADHPDVAIDLNNLAGLYQATNRRALAEPLMVRAVAIFTASLGAEHPNTVIVTENLAILRREMAAGD